MKKLIIYLMIGVFFANFAKGETKEHYSSKQFSIRESKIKSIQSVGIAIHYDNGAKNEEVIATVKKTRFLKDNVYLSLYQPTKEDLQIVRELDYAKYVKIKTLNYGSSYYMY